MLSCPPSQSRGPILLFEAYSESSENVWWVRVKEEKSDDHSKSLLLLLHGLVALSSFFGKSSLKKQSEK